ncbi:leader peptidase (prepilin peptidase)/N-methyltransferase [Okibacterium sp. HSC-33S16]|uniref:prepilin peptidase n=1 Tax=Okibacterium sp. HSC-33S16 TaxID=2910965 RepID=UPI0020A0A6F3|nr:A24 family peptidase [Okibacterium sp. HSC-33S16]MCP2029971.1 leader peptidase (prepilin peptidase)/N-methyltransferase [Okibacterium sp. HSC-33S16]
MSATLATFVPVVVVTVGMLGLLVGSFLNVVVYRVPNGMSVVAPPSACPGCGSGIKAYDNIPVLSWLALRGKCRTCHEPISARYPLVEIGAAVFFAAVGVWWWLASGSSLASSVGLVATVLLLVAYLWLAGVSVALALIDIDTHKLPNVIVLPSYIVGGILLATASILQSDFDALIRAGIGMAVLWLAYFAMAMLYPGGMGFGDVKLAGLLGLYLGYIGWGPLLVGAFAAFFLGGIYAIGLMTARKVGRKSGIPFGPWMLAGAWIGIFAGPELWTSYLALLGVA